MFAISNHEHEQTCTAASVDTDGHLLYLSMLTMSFFATWPTWAKLSFALASTFILVLVMAGLVKLRKMIKIRRLGKKATTDPETASIHRQGRLSDETPFGAKAMMEDPDVEGVWNSRASTPLQSPVLEPRRSSPSRNPFSRSRRSSSVSSLCHLNSSDNTAGRQSMDPEKIRTSNLDGTPASASPLLCRLSIDTTWQSRGPVISSQSSPLPRRRSVTIRATSAQEAARSESTQTRSTTSSVELSSTRRSRVLTDPIPATPTRERRGRSFVLSGPPLDPSVVNRTPTTKRALDRMEAHRNFHAAESGSLQPRFRSSSGKSLGHKHSVSDHTEAGHETSRAVSWPVSSGEILVDFQAPKKIQTQTSPQVVPFRAFVGTHQPPKSPTKLPPSAWTDKTQELLNEKLEAHIPKRKIMIKNEGDLRIPRELATITNKGVAKERDETASPFERQGRRVNNGFEILPVGFLNRSESSKDFGNDRDPVRRLSDQISKPRKLQKKNRSRSRSRDSQKS